MLACMYCLRSSQIPFSNLVLHLVLSFFSNVQIQKSFCVDVSRECLEMLKVGWDVVHQITLNCL